MRKRAVRLLLIAIPLSLAAILGVNLLRFRSKQLQVAPIVAAGERLHWLKDDGEPPAVARLQRILRIPTVSMDDPAQIDYGRFLALHDQLAADYPSIHSALKKTVINRYSLLYEWTGADASLAPVILCAHLDVVPVQRERWAHDPFAAEIADGQVWGRGALDDKGSLVSLLEAVERLVEAGYRPRRTVYLAFGHDEERGGPAGREGAAEIAAYLRRRGVHAALALDEGAMVDGAASPVRKRKLAIIAVSQKGYVSLRLTAAGTGGHAMAPPVQGGTVISTLARAIVTLEEHQHPHRLTPEVDEMFDYLGPEMPAPERLIFANRWLFERLILNQLSRTDTGAAFLRTTLAPTLFHAGIKEQSLPESGWAVVNFRTLPGESAADVLAYARERLAGQKVSVALNGEVQHEPTRRSRVRSPSYLQLERTIREVFPDTMVAPSLSTGRTDVEYYKDLADDAYLFAPYLFSPALIETVHGHNERIGIDQFLDMVRFYERLIRNLDE